MRLVPDLPAPPVLTQDLVDRMEQAAVAFGRAWLAGIGGLDLGDFGPHLLVGCHPDRPHLDFQNRVNGLRPADAAAIPAIGRFYDERGVRPWWELAPADDFAVVASALAARGAEQIGFHAMAYGAATATASTAVSAGVEIVVVDPGDTTAFATFSETRVAGHELPAEVVEQATADLAGWRRAPGTTLYLATVDGAPAATAVLTVDGGVGYLADAATLPEYRRRDLQGALIRRRIRDAAAAGCDVVCSQATFAGPSHRNLQRHGLVGGLTKVVWR